MAGAFHFLRPEWLLALVPAALLAALLHRRLRAGRNDWERVVDAHLLVHLASPERRTAGQWQAVLLFTGWAAAVFAMAGPTWQKLPQPVSGRLDPVVVALSLGRSMAATDASPNRLAAARFKVADALARVRGGEVALVLYADIPFTAAPLTEDARVVAQMLPDLGTDLMRGNVNRPEAGIDRAVELLKGAGAMSGRILLLTDSPGDDPRLTQAAARTAAAAGYRVNVIGVGGAGGTAPVDTAALEAIATAGHGAYSPLTADDRDLERTLPPVASGGGGVTDSEGFAADVWADMGPFILLLALLLAPLAFRRGWIAVLLVAAGPALLAPPAAQAQGLPALSELPANWDDLWWRPDQQGAAAFARGDYAGAAEHFVDPAWRASALYKAGDHAGAAATFAGVPGADYNRGNALARAGQLEDAVAAYDAALAATPDDADAKFNRDLVQSVIDARKKPDPPPGGGGGGGGGGDGGQSSGGGQPPKPDKPGAGEQRPQQQQAGQPKENQPQENQPQEKEPKANEPQANQPPPGTPPAEPAPLPPRRPAELASNAQPPQSPPQQAQPQSPPPQPQQPAAPQAPPPEAPPPIPPGPQARPGDPPGNSDPNTAFDAPPSAPSQPQPPQQPQDKPQPAPTLSDDAQSREQALRQVPDDPGGLLRARIRAQYSGRPVSMPEEDLQ